MQAIMETLFDIVYLTTVILLGVTMVRRAGGNKQYRLFGIMAVILGCGDAFHLVPRAYALCTTGLANFPAALGIGKLVTSITMTVFYLILYTIFTLRYKENNKTVTMAVYLLAAVRIVLCLFPQNLWTSADPSLAWGIYRNLPFAAMGILIIVLFYRHAKADKAFRYMWLAITLSFAFYVPVVLWADAIPLVGTLMIPKTVCYVWIVWMGYSDMKSKRA